MLGDPGFPVKLAIELGIGVTMKLLAELNKRGDHFNQELDFVFANVVMAIIADTMLVWLPAPRASFSTKAAAVNQSAMSKWLKSCPDNAFQVGMIAFCHVASFSSPKKEGMHDGIWLCSEGACRQQADLHDLKHAASQLDCMTFIA